LSGRFAAFRPNGVDITGSSITQFTPQGKLISQDSRRTLVFIEKIGYYNSNTAARGAYDAAKPLDAFNVSFSGL